jgi:hypothetical protein
LPLVVSPARHWWIPLPQEGFPRPKEASAAVPRVYLIFMERQVFAVGCHRSAATSLPELKFYFLIKVKPGCATAADVVVNILTGRSAALAVALTFKVVSNTLQIN